MSDEQESTASAEHGERAESSESAAGAEGAVVGSIGRAAGALDAESIAAVCHAANRAYREEIGEEPGPTWRQASAHLRASVIDGVRAYVEGRITGPEQSHENWLRFKEADGWTYGAEKDEEKKTHPCFLPYADLPEAQRAKDEVFRAVVLALSPEARAAQLAQLEQRYLATAAADGPCCGEGEMCSRPGCTGTPISEETEARLRAVEDEDRAQVAAAQQLADEAPIGARGVRTYGAKVVGSAQDGDA